MKKLFTFITFCMLLCTACLAQTAKIEFVCRKGNTIEYKYGKYTSIDNSYKFVTARPTNWETRGYAYMGANYCRPTKIEGNLQAVTDEVLKKYPNEKFPEELSMEIFFTLQKETLAVKYSYRSSTWEIISPCFLEDLTKAILKTRKLVGLKFFGTKPEFPIYGITETATVKLR